MPPRWEGRGAPNRRIGVLMLLLFFLAAGVVVNGRFGLRILNYTALYQGSSLMRSVMGSNFSDVLLWSSNVSDVTSSALASGSDIDIDAALQPLTVVEGQRQTRMNAGKIEGVTRHEVVGERESVGEGNETAFWARIIREAEEYYSKGAQNRSCAPSKREARMYQCEAIVTGVRSLNSEIFGGFRYVAETPPSKLFRMWGMRDLAADYDAVQRGRWMVNASRYLSRMHSRLSEKTIYDSQGSKGGFKHVSNAFDKNHTDYPIKRYGRQLARLAGYNYETTIEPNPGVLVLHNAHYTSEVSMMTDCSIGVWGHCFGRVNLHKVYDDFMDDYAVCAPGSKKALPKTEHVVALQNLKRRFFYHWVTEGLARVMQVEGLMRTHPHIRFTAEQRKYKEFVSLLGLKNDAAPREGCAKYLWIPEMTACAGVSVAQAHITRAVLRRTIFDAPESHVYMGPGTRRHVILIKRTRDVRAITNHNVLASGLSSRINNTHNLIVHGGNETLHEQLALFAHSDGVVAPHGAGLSLILAMQRGSAVYEFLVHGGSNTSSTINLCYMNIAQKLELRYLSQLVGHDRGSQSSNMIVDVETAVDQFADLLYEG